MSEDHGKQCCGLNPPDSRKHRFLTIDRIKSLTDCVFSIVMTMLIFDIKLGSFGDRTDTTDLALKIINLGPKMESYFITFLILGLFWITHHHIFHFIKWVDRGLLWFNIFFLILICLIPFSMDLVITYPHDKVATLIFGLNMVLVSTQIFFIWKYATRDHHLIDHNLDAKIIQCISKSTFYSTVIFGVSIFASYYSIYFSYLLYTIIPFICRYDLYRDQTHHDAVQNEDTDKNIIQEKVKNAKG
jgi:uncharacterized membrane protein